MLKTVCYFQDSWLKMTNTINELERKIQALHFVSIVFEISNLETWESRF